MEKVKEFFDKKYIKIIMNIIRVIFAIMFVAFILMVCLQRFSGNKVSFFNFRMFTVASGSMKPKYDIGDVLISKEVKPEDVKVGDTISYLGEKNDFNGKVITHEVVDIKKDASGKYLFHTKGLSNLVEDPIVYEHQLYGVVIHKMLLLSFVYKIVGTSYGLFLFVILPLLYIIGSEILSMMLFNEEKRRSKVNN